MRTKAELVVLKCKRCKHEWVPRIPTPAVCPCCHSPYWDRPLNRKRQPLRPSTVGVKGIATKKNIRAFAVRVLADLRLDWEMRLITDSTGICIHKSREICVPVRMVGQYDWVAKEYVLHEVAHISTVSHGKDFYEEYAALLVKYMTESE